MKKNYKALMFKALCRILKFKKEEGEKLSVSLSELSYEFSKVTEEDWIIVGTRRQNNGNIVKVKRFYAIAHSLEETGLVEINKGSKKSTTKMYLTDSGWNYIKKLRNR